MRSAWRRCMDGKGDWLIRLAPAWRRAGAKRKRGERCQDDYGTNAASSSAAPRASASPRRFQQERARLVVIGLEPPQERELTSECMVLTGDASSEPLVAQMFADA